MGVHFDECGDDLWHGSMREHAIEYARAQNIDHWQPQHQHLDQQQEHQNYQPSTIRQQTQERKQRQKRKGPYKHEQQRQNRKIHNHGTSTENRSNKGCPNLDHSQKITDQRMDGPNTNLSHHNLSTIKVDIKFILHHRQEANKQLNLQSSFPRCSYLSLIHL